MWSSTQSKTSIVFPPSLYVAGFDKSASGKSAQIVYLSIFAVHSTIKSVIFSGEGPPFSQLYLIPKSSLMPPGLWEAEQMKPPNGTLPAPRQQITAEVAGVDRSPFWPHQIVPTPAANAIL